MSYRENIIENKSFDFAIRIVRLYKHLSKDNDSLVLAKQLLRCGTSIGANVSEAQKAQSRADFRTKMTIALKEANDALLVKTFAQNRFLVFKRV